MATILTSTAFGAALVLGFRHGFDWDHIAALTDLTGSQTSSRRSMRLATLYAAGHAVMVVVLGSLAILFAERVPDAVDGAMERLVGASLVALAIWILWSTIVTRGAPPLRSRWMVLIGGVRAALARWRGRDVVVIEHAHPHDHHGGLHDHRHAGADQEQAVPSAVAVQHAHLHRHVARLPRDPFASYSGGSAFGIGLLHGVGAETPTQVVVFVTAANASGRPASIAMLLCFVVGLLAANTVVAGASTFGFRRLVDRPGLTLGLALVTAAFSLVVGGVLLTGHGTVLPAILS
jgi:high-affinity nickel-transport protein